MLITIVKTLWLELLIFIYSLCKLQEYVLVGARLLWFYVSCPPKNIPAIFIRNQTWEFFTADVSADMNIKCWSRSFSESFGRKRFTD